MTSKSDPRGHPGLKLCVHVSVMGCYRFTNFRRNRRGSGSKWHFFGWFHMEWPFCKSRNHWVSIHTSNFNKIGQSDPEIRRWGGVQVRMCRDAPFHPWLVESTYLVTPNPHTKFEHNRPSRSWDTEVRSARAHVQRYPTHDLCEAPSSWPPTDTPKLNPIGRAVPEIQKRGLHVRTFRDTPSMTCVKHLVHDPQLTYQNWTQSAEPFLRYRSAVCTCRDTPPVTAA